MDPIFSLYVQKWLDCAPHQKMQRMAALYEAGRSVVECALKAESEWQSKNTLRSAIARRMYQGSAETLRLIDLADQRKISE